MTTHSVTVRDAAADVSVRQSRTPVDSKQAAARRSSDGRRRRHVVESDDDVGRRCWSVSARRSATHRALVARYRRDGGGSSHTSMLGAIKRRPITGDTPASAKKL